MRLCTILAVVMVVTLGLAATASAQLAIKRSSGGLVFATEDFAVQVGRGGSVDQRSDTDLIVYDPNGTSIEAAFHFNASQADLHLGSGDPMISGRDGDLYLEDGHGQATVLLDGSDGRLLLGVAGQDGDLWLRDSANTVTLQVDGQSGNLTNAFSGNGVVKAWARINANGTVESCFRCNTSATETRSIAGAGSYEVDFTPLATDISSRPRSAVLDSHSGAVLEGGITLADRSGDASSVFVRTTDPNGTDTDIAFTLLIY